jgi:pimeloyl-ACP methyl ester carboxylesterase
MLRKIVVSLVVIIGLGVAGLLAFMYLAPERFTQAAITAARRHAGLERKEITLPDGLRYVYLEGGKGETLLLLHGFNANKDNFVQIAPYLSDRYHLIIPDHIGFGESSRPLQADYSPDVQAERLHALLQALDVHGRVNVGGNSMGGMISLHYGLRYPAETSSLWLLDPAGMFSAPKTEYMKVAFQSTRNPLEINNVDEFSFVMSKAMARPPFFPQPMLEVFAREIIDNKAVAQKVFDSMMKSDIEARVAGLSLPTLIVWGDHDEILHPAGAGILHKLLPDSQVVIMPGIGHMPMLEDPARTAADFLHFQDALARKVH